MYLRLLKNGSLRERGQAALLMTMSIVVALGAVGLVVDVGWAYFRKEACKVAAQSAALAGVKAAQSSATYFNCASANPICQAAPAPCPATLGTPGNAIQAACLYAKQNGFTDDPTHERQRVIVKASNGTPPVTGMNPTYWMSVTVSEKIPGLFASIFGGGRMTVAARSTAAYFLPSVGGCIYTLDPTNLSVTTSGNPVLTSGCGLYVNSNNPEAVLLNGNAKILATNGSDVNIVGGWNSTGGATISPAPKLGVAPVADPFTMMNPPTVGPCESSGVVLSNQQTGTINPGVICNGISLAGQSKLTMNPGLYVIKGGFSITGQASVTGAGVTLYIADGTANLTGGTDIHLTAPDSGYWQGILFYQDRNNTNPVTLVGGSGADIKGAIYVPSAALNLAGGSSGDAFSATIVSKTLNLVGNTYLSDPVETKFTSGNAGVYLIE